MKATLAQLRNVNTKNALEKILVLLKSKPGLSIKKTFQFRAFLEARNTAVLQYEEMYRDLVTRYADKNEDGTLVVKKDEESGADYHPIKDMENFSKDHIELLNHEVDLPDETGIDVDILDQLGIQLSYDEISQLDALIFKNFSHPVQKASTTALADKEGVPVSKSRKKKVN